MIDVQFGDDKIGGLLHQQNVPHTRPKAPPKSRTERSAICGIGLLLIASISELPLSQ